MEYFNNHTRYIRRYHACTDFLELPEERRPRSSLDAFDSPSVEIREPRGQPAGPVHPRGKDYQVVDPGEDAPTFSGIWRRLSSAKCSVRSFFSSHNLVPRLLPAQLSLDCERDLFGTETRARAPMVHHVLE